MLDTKRLLYLLVLFVVFVLHISYLSNGFVWLDHGDIEAGRAIVPLDQLPSSIFTRFGDTGFYRPLVAASESIDAAVYGDWAPGFHLTNVLLHLGVVALVPFFLGAFFSFTFFELLIAMVVVGLHPLGWLPVGAISYRSELLLAVFVMLTVYLHSQARRKGSSLFEFFTVISFFLALLSKETALFLVPMLIILWEFTRKRHSRGRPDVRRPPAHAMRQGWGNPEGTNFLSLFLSELIVVILYLLLRLRAVPEMWQVSSPDLSWSEAIGMRVMVVSKLLFAFINPLKPDLSDAVTVRGLDIMLVIGIVVFGTCIVVIVKKTGIFSSWSKALFLCMILLLPAFGIVPVPRLGSPHYGYIALLGFAPIVLLFLRLFQKKFLRASIYAVCFVWICVMGFTTFLSGSQFKNDLTLFTPEVKKDPHFLEGYFYLGNFYLSRQELASAQQAYQNALNISSKVVAYSEQQSVLMNLATTKALMKRILFDLK